MVDDAHPWYKVVSSAISLREQSLRVYPHQACVRCVLHAVCCEIIFGIFTPSMLRQTCYSFQCLFTCPK